jgi:hypothetical protein
VHRYFSLLKWPVTLGQRRHVARIIAAVKNIDVSILTHMWQELEYRIDVCRVARGAHIKHL